jgi:hypothetical protein
VIAFPWSNRSISLTVARVLMLTSMLPGAPTKVYHRAQVNHACINSGEMIPYVDGPCSVHTLVGL